MTCEKTGPAFRGDLEEMDQFGHEDFARVLAKSIRAAVERHYANKKRTAIHLRRVESGVIQGHHRLAPRFFTPHTIFEIAKRDRKSSFILRYLDDNDKEFALESAMIVGIEREAKGWRQMLGSQLPTIGVSFDLRKTVRALFKIAVNLIAAYCPNTPVNPTTFQRAINTVLHDKSLVPQTIAGNGFVDVKGVEPIKSSDGSHSFRLLHTGSEWWVYSSFFGGRLGSAVAFSGPNREPWDCADIVAPIKSNQWTIKTSRISQPLRVQVEWQDQSRLMPSLKMQNAVAKLRVEVAETR